MNYKKSDMFFGTANVFLENEIIAENLSQVKIFNCSTESILNMFNKVDLRDILKHRNENDN